MLLLTLNECFSCECAGEDGTVDASKILAQKPQLVKVRSFAVCVCVCVCVCLYVRCVCLSCFVFIMYQYVIFDLVNALTGVPVTICAA